MANSFTLIGKIAAMKETEKFKPIETKTFPSSGWQMTNVRFNCISGTNRIMCTVQGGKFTDDAKNVVIKTVGQTPENGGKRPLIDIPWNKRFDEDQINLVAGFRRYVVDLDNPRMRYKLQDLIKAFEEDGDTEALIEETGCDTIEQAKEALDKSNKRRHTFIHPADFAEYMAKVVASDKIKDKMFRISGNQEIQYSKGMFYSNYMVNRVELIDAEPSATMNIDFYFAEDCVDYDEGKGNIAGWGTYYDSQLKKTGFYPLNIVIRGDEDEADMLRDDLVVNDGEIGNIGLIVNIIDGAEITGITMEDLDDRTRRKIEKGYLKFEDVVKANGGSKIGDRTTELRFAGYNARKSSAEDTTYTIEDMKPATATIADQDEDEDL